MLYNKNWHSMVGQLYSKTNNKAYKQIHEKRGQIFHYQRQRVREGELDEEGEKVLQKQTWLNLLRKDWRKLR